MSHTINVVMSADDRFAVGLAGTVKSALSCLSTNCSLQLYVLDGGITAANKAALLRHWNDVRLAVEWVSIDRRRVSAFVVSHHASDAVYYRLLAPQVLPPKLHKFIFLDADLLVRRDLHELWQTPMQGSPCLAVQDIGAPYIDSAIALQRKQRDYGKLAIERPISNYVQLGLKPDNSYFNSGVLVIDLDAWRREDLASQMLKVLVDHSEHVLWWDQYALNVVLSGRWKPLNPLWNQNSIVYRFEGWRESRFCTQQYPMYFSAPWIAHFNWLKPWQAECTHPLADEFLGYLEHSPWHVRFDRRPAATEPPPARRKFFARKKAQIRRLLRVPAKS